MELRYDLRYNSAYIRLREKTTEVETIRISDDANIDLSPDGKIYGIELLNANEQLRIMEGTEFILTDESTQKTLRFPIAAQKG
jgi:uncharacterized protein YuzE